MRDLPSVRFVEDAGRKWVYLSRMIQGTGARSRAPPAGRLMVPAREALEVHAVAARRPSGSGTARKLVWAAQEVERARGAAACGTAGPSPGSGHKRTVPSSPAEAIHWPSGPICDVADRCLVADQQVGLLTRDRAHAHDAVAAAGQDELPRGVPGHARHQLSVGLEGAERLLLEVVDEGRPHRSPADRAPRCTPRTSTAVGAGDGRRRRPRGRRVAPPVARSHRTQARRRRRARDHRAGTPPRERACRRRRRAPGRGASRDPRPGAPFPRGPDSRTRPPPGGGRSESKTRPRVAPAKPGSRSGGPPLRWINQAPDRVPTARRSPCGDAAMSMAGPPVSSVIRSAPASGRSGQSQARAAPDSYSTAATSHPPCGSMATLDNTLSGARRTWGWRPSRGQSVKARSSAVASQEPEGSSAARSTRASRRSERGSASIGPARSQTSAPASPAAAASQRPSPLSVGCQNVASVGLSIRGPGTRSPVVRRPDPARSRDAPGVDPLAIGGELEVPGSGRRFGPHVWVSRWRSRAGEARRSRPDRPRRTAAGRHRPPREAASRVMAGPSRRRASRARHRAGDGS